MSDAKKENDRGLAGFDEARAWLGLERGGIAAERVRTAQKRDKAKIRAKRDGLGRGLFAAASIMGGARAVSLFLSEGADPNFRCDNKRTPLMAAAMAGDVESMDLLLAAGADPALKNGEGFGALECAFDGGSVEALERAMDMVGERVRSVEELRERMWRAVSTAGKISFGLAGWERHIRWLEAVPPRTAAWLFAGKKALDLASLGGSDALAVFAVMRSCLREGEQGLATEVLGALNGLSTGFADGKLAQGLVSSLLFEDDAAGLLWALENGFLAKGGWRVSVGSSEMSKADLKDVPLVWAGAWFGAGRCLGLMARMGALRADAMEGSERFGWMIHLSTGLAAAKALDSIGADFGVGFEESTGRGLEVEKRNWLESMLLAGPTKEALEWVGKTKPELLCAPSGKHPSAFEALASHRYKGSSKKEVVWRWRTVCENAALAGAAAKAGKKRKAPLGSSV